jgi:cobalt-zinc-cadmium efflux system protein
VLILFGAIRLLRKTVSVLMENAPESVDVAKVRQMLLETAGVESVHCLHVWTIGTNFRAMTAHVVHGETESAAGLLERLQERIGGNFPLEHVTLQLEPAGYTRCHGDGDWCRLEPLPADTTEA